MDKLSSMYRARYEEAEQHAVNGNNEKALDICRELRLRPELSHYRRAYVNLLIATLFDIRTHPDCNEGDRGRDWCRGQPKSHPSTQLW
jgi:hypothetical protein